MKSDSRRREKTILLIGKYSGNTGPSNVNKALLDCAGTELKCLKRRQRVPRLFELLTKARRADIILISGVCSARMLKVIKLTRKPVVYLMHGCFVYENEINRLYLPRKVLDAEKDILSYAEIILPVSEWYSEWVKARCPQFSDKIFYLNNGISLTQRVVKKKEMLTIAVSGGNRCIKNNLSVCRAVEQLRHEGVLCKVLVFGRAYPENDRLEQFTFVKMMGQMDKEEYYCALDAVSLFVMVSDVEPFGLAIADALSCHCSVLLSQSVGCKSIFTLTDADIIDDPHDIGRLGDKIYYLLLHPNAERIRLSMDVESCSAERAYQRLRQICDNIE